jgi:hypothetical protein
LSEYSEYFTSRKPSKWGEHVIAVWHRRMLKIALKVIPGLQNKTILEIGAGCGFFAESCQQQNLNYYGLEMNAEQAGRLSAAGHKVSAATIPPIPAGEPVQLVWMSHMLEHADSYQTAKQMLLAAHERLDRDGYVAIIAPDVLHWKELFWSVDWSHGFPTSVNRVEQLLNETGFSVHRSMHHTATVTNSFSAWLISWFCRLLVPVGLLDYFFVKMTGRTLCMSFMCMYGLRQIFVVGKRNG